jgi:hypothetical protein
MTFLPEKIFAQQFSSSFNISGNLPLVPKGTLGDFLPRAQRGRRSMTIFG